MAVEKRGSGWVLGRCLGRPPLPGSMSSEPVVTVTVTLRDATEITRCDAGGRDSRIPVGDPGLLATVFSPFPHLPTAFSTVCMAGQSSPTPPHPTPPAHPRLQRYTPYIPPRTIRPFQTISLLL